MTEFLLRMFVRDYRDAESPRVHSAIGKLAGVTGIVCNLLLFVGKLVVGLLAGSLSILADAVNNLSDASSSVVTLLGFRMAQQPADRDHPYGHARYEYLSGLVVAALILLVGAELARSSVEKILHPSPVEFSAALFGVLAAAIAVKVWMSAFFGALGRRIGSTTLKATSVDSRNDVIASSAVLAGCAVEYLAHVNVDGFMGLAVALFILWSGIGIARETISPLLGKRADGALVERISRLVLSHDKVLGIHDLLVHDYGPGQCYASVHVELSAQEDALEQLNVHLVIHYDPVVQNDAERNEMEGELQDILHQVEPRLAMHDFRLVRGAKQTKLVFDLEVPYELMGRRQEFKREIDQALQQRGRDYTTVIRYDGKG